MALSSRWWGPKHCSTAIPHVSCRSSPFPSRPFPPIPPFLPSLPPSAFHCFRASEDEATGRSCTCCFCSCGCCWDGSLPSTGRGNPGLLCVRYMFTPPLPGFLLSVKKRVKFLCLSLLSSYLLFPFHSISFASPPFPSLPFSPLFPCAPPPGTARLC